MDKLYPYLPVIVAIDRFPFVIAYPTERPALDVPADEVFWARVMAARFSKPDVLDALDRLLRDA